MNIKTTSRNWFDSLAYAIAFLPLALPALAQEAPFTSELAEIQQSWDQANYQSANTEEKQRQLEALSMRSEALASKYPRSAEPLVWEGIVLSTYAGAKGGLGALAIAKKSRDCLLEATRIDPAALRGSAYTSLGALYYKVPGWPIGFGDDDKAAGYLQKALALNPDGMDPNYFMGELMYEKGEYSRSLQHLQKALAAPPRAGRPIADAGRRAEIDTLMAKVRTKLQRVGAR
jgi:tetratricopeptide (TPR) repeat protein